MVETVEPWTALVRCDCLQAFHACLFFDSLNALFFFFPSRQNLLITGITGQDGSDLVKSVTLK